MIIKIHAMKYDDHDHHTFQIKPHYSFQKGKEYMAVFHPLYIHINHGLSNPTFGMESTGVRFKFHALSTIHYSNKEEHIQNSTKTHKIERLLKKVNRYYKQIKKIV